MHPHRRATALLARTLPVWYVIAILTLYYVLLAFVYV